jgi:hypothetical protein
VANDPLGFQRLVKQTGQNMLDSVTLKKQRQQLGDAAQKAYDKYVPNVLKPGPPKGPISTWVPKASTPKPSAPAAKPGSFKKGGVVQKTGLAKVHKGERVLTVKQQKRGK